MLWHLEPVDTGNPLSRINYIQEITSNLPASKTLICKQTNSESIPPTQADPFIRPLESRTLSPALIAAGPGVRLLETNLMAQGS